MSAVVGGVEGRSCCHWGGSVEEDLAIAVDFAVGAAASFEAVEGPAARWDSSAEGLAAVVEDLVAVEATSKRR